MLYPVIRVKDADGREHIVGEDIHDTLYIDGDGAIRYMNTHCCSGMKFPEEGYRFVGVDSTDENSLSGRPEIGFVTLERLIEMEAEDLRDRVRRWEKLREHISEETKKMAVAGTGTGKAAAKEDDPLIDSVICPVSRNNFYTVSPEAFLSVINSVIRRLRRINLEGRLRMMDSENKTCGDLVNFVQRVFPSGNENIVYAYALHPDDLFDPSPECEEKIADEYPLLTGIAVKNDGDIIRRTADEKGDRALLAEEIERLMKHHYYTEDEESQLTDVFNMFIKAEKKAREEEKKAETERHLASLRSEGDAIYRKYGVRFEYGYAVHVRRLHGKERADKCWNGEPAPKFFAKLVPDRDYAVRREKYDRLAKEIGSAIPGTGNKGAVSYYLSHGGLKDFWADSRLTRKENPIEKTIAYLDGEQKKELSHWTAIDVACCSEKLFGCLLRAMYEYAENKGVSIKGL